LRVISYSEHFKAVEVISVVSEFIKVDNYNVTFIVISSAAAKKTVMDNNDNVNDTRVIIRAVAAGDVEYLQTRQFDPNLLDKYDVPILHVAIEANKKEVVDLLVNRVGIDLTLPEPEYGNTPLMTAAAYASAHGDFDNFWLLLSRPQAANTLQNFNIFDRDVVDILSVYQHHDVIRYLYEHFPTQMHPVHNLLETFCSTPEFDVLIDFFLNMAKRKSPTDFADGQCLIELCGLQLEQATQEAQKEKERNSVMRVFNCVVEHTTNLNAVDNKGLTAINYCAIENNITCFKKLLLTGEIVISQHRLLYRVQSETMKLLISQYFDDKEQCLARWRKELDIKRSNAADLYAVYMHYYRCRCYFQQQQHHHHQRCDYSSDGDDKIVRFFRILTRLNDDSRQILCLRSCGSTKEIIPEYYIRIAHQDLLSKIS